MLKQTDKLIQKYGKKLIDGTILDAHLRKLLISPAEKKSPFKKYPASGYVDPNKVDDKNFGVMDGMKDFVLHLVPQMPRTVLHQITARLIQHSPATIERNTFMRQAGIAKVFLAYELYLDPDAAEEHFSTMRMKSEFPGPNDIANLQRVILEPIIVFFEENLNVGRRNSLAGFTEPMPQAPTDSFNETSSAPTPVIMHERIPSEPFPVAPKISPAILAQMAAAESLDANPSNKEEVTAQVPATIESLLAANPISSRKPAPFKRDTPVNSNSAATTESSNSIDNAMEVNEIKSPSAAAPTHAIINELISSEPVPVAPDLLTRSLPPVATAEPLDTSNSIEVAENPVSPGKFISRRIPANSNSAATTASSSLTDKDVAANDKESVSKKPMPASAAPVRPTLSTGTPAQQSTPAITVTTTTQVSTTAATANSSAPNQNIPKQPAIVVASTAKEQPRPSVTRPEAVKSTAAGGVLNNITSVTSPTLTRAAQAAEPARSIGEANPTLSQLTTLCRDYARHLKPYAIKDNRASKKLGIVNEMITHLENSRVPNATLRIRNMSMLLTDDNKAILKEQRSGFGVKFLETLLNILTVGLYSKCTKNTFSFWKSHGEVLSDNVDNLTKDISNPSMK